MFKELEMENRRKLSPMCLIVFWLMGGGEAAFAAQNGAPGPGKLHSDSLSFQLLGSPAASVPATRNKSSLPASFPSRQRNTLDFMVSSVPSGRGPVSAKPYYHQAGKDDLPALARLDAPHLPKSENTEPDQDSTASFPQSPQARAMSNQERELTWQDLTSARPESDAGTSGLPGAVWVLGSTLIGLGLLERIRRT